MVSSPEKRKPLLKVDWTQTNGNTPFYEQASSDHPARYAVAIDTGIVKFTDLNRINRDNLILEGANKILNFYDKDPVTDASTVYATIPNGGGGGYDTSGTFVPLRPQGTIKVLVTIPDIYNDTTLGTTFIFDEIQSKEAVLTVGAYDEIELNTYGLTKKVQKISKLLKKYEKESKNFEGRVYNIDFSQQATKVVNFASQLRKLVRKNKFIYSEDRADMIMIGVDSSYTPLYSQISQGEDFHNLDLGFNQFEQSKFVDSNTAYIYRHFEKINKIASAPNPSVDWQKFLDQYIKFPPAIIEHTQGRPESPVRTEKQKEAIRESNATIDEHSLESIEARIRSKKHKEEMAARQKTTSDWVGDNVLGNMDKTIDMVNGLEDMYFYYLDKIGITHIMKAAMRCLALDLPIEDVMAFLQDARAFTAEVVEIIKRPIITLDDLIPTVDIMWDIMKQVLLAIVEAIFWALWDMLKNIIYTLLDNCKDPCAANFGGISIGDMLTKGGKGGFDVGALAGGLAGPALSTAMSAGGAAAQNALSTGNFEKNTREFLGNLSSKVSDEQIKTLTKPMAGPAAGLAAGAESAISNSPIGKFFEELSPNLTCGEANTLFGEKASPLASEVVQTVANNLCKKYPNNPAFDTLCSLLSDKDSVNAFFGGAAKVADIGGLAAQVDEAAEFFPNLTGCLTDQEDSEMRCALLEKKGVPEDFCNDQIKTSRERAIERLGQLQTFFEDPSKELQKAIPPIYCTYKDGRVVEGLVPNDHPSFTSMMDTTLNTIFDGVYSIFTQDILKVPDNMKLEVPGPPKEIDRVIEIPLNEGGLLVPGILAVGEYGFGYGWAMNPEFEMAIEQGFKANPPYWKSPPWSDDALGSGEEDPGTEDPNDMIEFEENGRKRTIAWNHNVQAAHPYKKPTTEVLFSPGMSGSDGVYANFQIGYLPWTRPETLSTANLVARNRLNTDKKNLQISIENTLKTELQKHGEPGAVAKLQSFLEAKKSDPAFSAAMEGMDLSNLFGVDRYAISLTSFSDVEVGKDKFSVRIVGDSPGSGDIEFYRKAFIFNVHPSVANVTSSRNLQWDTPLTGSTKEKHFVEFLQKIWTEGENIYTGSVDNLQKVSQPNYGKGFITDDPDGRIKEALLADQDPQKKIRSLYEELLRDLMAMCLTQVGNSRLLQGGANIFDLIDWAPIPQRGCPDPNLLDLESIKDWIKSQYKDSACIERSLPNVTGLGDNRNNAFESVSLSGVVKATIRLYAIEIVIKTLVTFSELQVEDLDEVLIGYLREKIIGEIRKKGYLNDFLAQALKMYNLDPDSVRIGPRVFGQEETNSTVALDFYIKEELKYAVRKLLQISGLDRPGMSVDDLLIKDDNSGWLPDFEAGQGVADIANDATKGPKSFHVSNQDKILGIKDWTNGSFVLEKYIRVEPTAWKDRGATLWAADATAKTGIFDVENLFPWFNEPLQGNNLPDLDIVGNGGGGGGNGDGATQIIFAANECDPAGSDLTIPPPGSPTPADAPPSTPPETFGRYFKVFRYGLRLVCKSGDNAQLNTAMGIDGGGAGFGSRRAQLLLRGARDKSYFIRDGVNPSDLDRFAFPVACVEIDVDKDTLLQEVIDDSDFFKNEYDQIFPTLIGMVKDTDEYKFMFDYCFPLKRLVSLCVLYNAAYVFPYPGLNNVFSSTKEQLRIAFEALLNSGNYNHKDANQNNRKPNFDVDLGIDYSQMALQLIFAIFKGLGESFSPNISIAKLIQDAANMISDAAISAVNTAKEVANDVSEATGGDPNWAGGPIDECDLPFEIPEIPIGWISLGLAPSDLIPLSPMPPLGAFGFSYLLAFGEWVPNMTLSFGNRTLGISKESKRRQRCALKKSGGVDTTSAAPCDPLGLPPGESGQTTTSWFASSPAAIDDTD